MKYVSRTQMDGLEGCTFQNRQDAKEMDAYDATRDGSTYRGGDHSTRVKSIIAASTNVVQLGELIIKVDTIGCSAYLASSAAAPNQQEFDVVEMHHDQELLIASNALSISVMSSSG
jgi:hypothetical protein